MNFIIKTIFALTVFLFLFSGVNAFAADDHKCKCPNKETCCVDKAHCAECPECKDCCKDGKHCSTGKGKSCAHEAKADGENASEAKDCCKGGKGKGKGTGKGKNCKA